MLVLTRKIDEKIVIGDNIKITLLRVRGNSVRLGIEAPRNVRIVRGELESVDGKTGGGAEFELSDREQVFAHPQGKIVCGRVKINDRRTSTATSPKTAADQAATSRGFGRVHRASEDGKPHRAPLAGFLSAT